MEESYHLFGLENYAENGGGMSEYVDSFGTLGEAESVGSRGIVATGRRLSWQHYEVVAQREGKLVLIANGSVPYRYDDDEEA